MSITLELAARVAALKLSDIAPQVQQWACRTFTDTVACGLAGAREQAVTHVVTLLSPQGGEVTLWGHQEKTTELDAAQINGMSAHILDYDDCHIDLDGHPSVAIVPALLAQGERLDCSGEDILTAYIAGIEAEIRLARLSHPTAIERGWHPTAIFGVMGAAVAVGHLLKLGPEKIAVALGIAASCAAGLRANSGTMTKALHAGLANRHGLQAALLARHGFSGSHDVFEHKLGFLSAFAKYEPTAAALMLEDWGANFTLLSPGIAIKQYPCCAFIHCAIEAAIKLHDRVKNAMIETVEVVLHHSRLHNIDRPKPRDGLDAKFSTQYLTARALLDGCISLSDFSEPCLSDRHTNTLMSKIQLVAHDDADISLGFVRVQLVDGSQHQAAASVAMGRGPDNPMTEGQFRAKFDDCVRTLLSPARAAVLYEKLISLPLQPSLRALTALMQAEKGNAHVTNR